MGVPNATAACATFGWALHIEAAAAAAAVPVVWRTSRRDGGDDDDAIHSCVVVVVEAVDEDNNGAKLTTKHFVGEKQINVIKKQKNFHIVVFITFARQ